MTQLARMLLCLHYDFTFLTDLLTAWLVGRFASYTYTKTAIHNENLREGEREQKTYQKNINIINSNRSRSKEEHNTSTL